MNEHGFKILKQIGSIMGGIATLGIAAKNIKKENDSYRKQQREPKKSDKSFMDKFRKNSFDTHNECHM